MANPQRIDSCDKAFDFLIRGCRIIDLFERRSCSSKLKKGSSLANFTRCLSGAFFNVAATLYKAEKYGIAIRFLLQACPMAVKAVELHDCSVSDEDLEGRNLESVDSKDTEAWKVHKEQLYRRWELLAICYSRTGDRKVRPLFLQIALLVMNLYTQACPR